MCAYTFRTSALNGGSNPYNAIDYLCPPLLLYGGTLMTMLAAYFDESYSHKPNPLVYTVAGYISTVQEWKRFQKEWTRELRRAGVDFFHMTTFEARMKNDDGKLLGVGMYKDWNNEKRVEVIKRLHRTIHRRVMVGIAASVVVADYDEVITPELRPGFGDPHEFAVIACLKHIRRWGQENGYSEPIAYVFESGSDRQKIVNSSFQHAYLDEEKRREYRIGSWAFADKRDLNPLQAADVLAYEVMKEQSRRLEKGNTRPVRRSMENLAKKAHLNEWYFYDREQLMFILNKCVELGVLPASALPNPQDLT